MGNGPANGNKLKCDVINDRLMMFMEVAEKRIMNLF